MNDEVFTQEQLRQLQAICVILRQQTQYVAETLRELLPEEAANRHPELTPEQVKYGLLVSSSSIAKNAKRMNEIILGE